MSKIELKKSILSKKYLNIDGEALADPSKKIPLSLLNGLIYPEPQIPKRGYATTKPWEEDGLSKQPILHKLGPKGIV